MDKFWALAQELDIKGLSSDVEDTTVVEKATANILVEYQEPKDFMSDEGDVVLIDTVSDTKDATSSVDIDNKIKSFLVRTEEKMANGHPAFSCKICGKKGHNASIRLHIETYHIDGTSQSCNNCGKS